MGVWGAHRVDQGVCALLLSFFSSACGGLVCELDYFVVRERIANTDCFVKLPLFCEFPYDNADCFCCPRHGVPWTVLRFFLS